MLDIFKIKIDRLLLNIMYWCIILPPRILLSLSSKYNVGIRIVFISVLILIKIINIIKTKKIDLFILFYIVYALYLFIITFINRGYIESALYQYGALSVGCILFVDIFSDNIDEFLISSYIYFLIFIVLNFFAMIIYHKNLIYGNTNNNFIFYFLFVFFSFFTNNKNKFILPFNIFIYLLILYCSYRFNATNTLIIILFYTIFLYIFNNEKCYKLFNNYTYLLIILLLFVLVVLPGEKSILSTIVSKIFNKPTTLSGRSLIYQNSINQFLKSPLIGFGLLKTADAKSILGNSWTHNLFLEQMVSGGIIGLILFLFILVYTVICIERVNKLNIKYILSTTLFFYLFRNMFETSIQTNALIFTILICFVKKEHHLLEFMKNE